MTGTIVRRGKKWAVVVDLGRQLAQRCPKCSNGRARLFWAAEGRHDACPECGGALEDAYRRRREWHSGFDRRRDAEEARIEILGRIQHGEHVARLSQTLEQYLLEEWIPTRRSKVEGNTWETQAVQVQAYVLPRLGSQTLQDITPSMLERLYADLLASGRSRGQGGLAPKTVKNVHGILHKALADAVRLGKLRTNPADQAEPPKVTPREKKVWSTEELRRFLAHIEDQRLYPSYLLAATTGMRRSEVLGLPWEAVDLERARVSVRQALVLVERKPVIKETPKTSRSRRTIRLYPQAVEALRRWEERQLFERLAWDGEWEDTGLVFTKEDGTPVRPNQWSRAFNRYVREAGLPKIPSKNLRHTHGTQLLAEGIDLRVVSGRLGHASVAITGDIYAAFTDSMDLQAVEKGAAALFEHHHEE